MEGVAQDGPQELGLRVLAFAQQLQAFGGRLLQHAPDDLVGLAARRNIVLLGRVQAQDVLAHLLVETRTGLLAQRTGLDQAFQHRRRGVAGEKRVVVQVVLQGLDDVGHGVQAHHVGRAEGAAARAAQLLAREVVDHVVAQAVGLGFLDGRQHAGNAHAVGDEVRRVLRAHHALAQGGGDEGFQVVEHPALGGGRVDQLHQRHVARRVEEVDAAEARLDAVGQHFAQLGDAQARGVAGHDGMRGQSGRDLLVQRQLPVHALGDGLDDQVALAQQGQVVLVVGLLNQHRILGHAQRRRLELLQPFDGLGDDAVLRAVLGGQVEQDDGNLAVDEVGSNLRAHHAGAEHGNLANGESTHEKSPVCQRFWLEVLA